MNLPLLLFQCRKCSATQTQSTLKATGHNYKDDSPATCIATGSKKCDICSATVSTPATGVHSFTIKSEPETCTTNGKYVCATCTETGLKKCTRCGITDTIPELKHTFKDEYTTDASKHWKECRRCSEVTGSGAHVYNTELKCKECGYSSLIKATKVTLSSLPLELFVGGTYNISATVTPSNATYNTVTWSSSNTSIAAVSAAGIVTVKGSGKVTITATTKEGISGSVTVYVYKETLNMQIGDIISFKDALTFRDSITFVEGRESILSITRDNILTALDSGEAVIEVFEDGSHYIRVKVARQEKITKQQVINLAGPAPVTVYSKSLGDISITYENILTDEFIRGSLENYYRYTVMPMLKEIPLDTEYSMSTGFYNAAPEGFGRWLWMMYGYMAPTQEEIIHIWLDLAGIIPIAGTFAEAYNTYLYYIEGDMVSALIHAGVVVFSAVGDYLLIKDIVSEVRFSFSSDAAVRLATVSDDVVDAATKQSIIRYLDDAEGAGKALENANYAQKTYSSKFSAEGQKIYSDLAGKPINTVDDLANALKSGTIKPSDVPIDYIVRDGNTLILNTRSSQALTQAGIPRSQWNAINQTGNSLFEEMLTNQLSRNGLTSAGTSTVKLSGGEN